MNVRNCRIVALYVKGLIISNVSNLWHMNVSMTLQVQADSASEGLDQFYDTIRYMEGKALIAIFNSNLFHRLG